MDSDDIKVLYIDDDDGWISLISDYLCTVDNIRLVGVCKSAEAAFQIVEKNETDIILLDVDLSILEYDGIDLASQLKVRQSAKIIMFTISGEKDTIEKSIIAGAVDYVIKSEYKKTLISTINRVYYSSSAEVMSDAIRKKDIEIYLSCLTTSERKVFERLCKGEKPDAIQKEFFYQPQSYWNCIGKIKKKLHVDNINDIVNRINACLYN